jgi:hypothetical protein
MHDLRDLREVLEDALGAYNAMFEVALFELAAHTSDESSPGGADDQWRAAMRGVDRAINKVEIRLGDDDPIQLAQRQLVTTGHKLWDAAEQGDKDAFEAASEEASAHYRVLVADAKERVGSLTEAPTV